MGYLLLEGDAELGGRMVAADSKELVFAGGADAQVDIIPAAAAQRFFTNNLMVLLLTGASMTSIAQLKLSKTSIIVLALKTPMLVEKFKKVLKSLQYCTMLTRMVQLRRN